MRNIQLVWRGSFWLLHVIVWSIVLTGLVLVLPGIIGIHTYAVLSGSMAPEICTGSVVLVDTNQRIPVKGDIITYQLGEMKVTHRVMKIHDDKYETKGDANELSDGTLVESGQIIGKVLLSIPYLGYFIAFLQSGIGKLTMSILALIYICLKFLKEKSDYMKGVRENVPVG